MSKSNWEKSFFVPKPGDKFRILPSPQPVIIDHINLVNGTRINRHYIDMSIFEEFNFRMKDMVRVERLRNEDKHLYLGEVLAYAKT